VVTEGRNAETIAETVKISGFHCTEKLTKNHGERIREMWRCDTRRYRLVRDYQFLSIYWLARKERLRLDGIRDFLQRQCEKSPRFREQYIRFDSQGKMFVSRSLIPLLHRKVLPTGKRKRKKPAQGKSWAQSGHI